MSEPIRLNEDYGKISENAKPGTTLPVYFASLIMEISGQLGLSGNLSGMSGLFYLAVPIKDGEALKGYLISDIMCDNRRILPSSANVMILGESTKKKKSGQQIISNEQIRKEGIKKDKLELFFAEYGQSFSDSEHSKLSPTSAPVILSSKHLNYSDAQKLKNSMYAVDLGRYQRGYLSELFSFFSCRLAALGQDDKLKRVQKLLDYCKEETLLPGSLKELKEILPSLIESYKNTTKPDDKRRFILLRAIEQTIYRTLDKNLDPYSGQEKYKSLLDPLYFSARKIEQSLEAVEQIRSKLKNEVPLSEEAKEVLKAADFYEDCLTAIYAKYAKPPLPKEDTTCFEIAAHKMKLAVVDYLKKKRGEEIPIDEVYGGIPWDLFRNTKDPFEQIAYTLPSIYSEHFCETRKLGRDDQIYRWALQHAEEMDVPVGDYNKLGTKQYEALNKAACLDNPEEKLAELNKAGFLKDLTSNETSKKSISKRDKNRLKKGETAALNKQEGACRVQENYFVPEMYVSVGDYNKSETKQKAGLLKDLTSNEQRVYPGKEHQKLAEEKRDTSAQPQLNKNENQKPVNSEGKSLKGRRKIKASYLSQYSSPLRYIPLTAKRKDACFVPEDDILLEMANQAGWQKSGCGKRLIKATKDGRDAKKHAVDYLIYKLKIEDCNKDDVEASIKTLQNRKISGKDLQNLDRPSTAKVILAAKKCGILIQGDCQAHLDLVLQRPHTPSLFF